MVAVAKIVKIDERRLAAKVKQLLAGEAEVAKKERILGPLRFEIGRDLAAKRKQWPERGPNAKGWGQFLKTIGLPQQRAHELMQSFLDPRPKREPSGVRDEDDGVFTDPVKPANRDAWCTPEWLCALLPNVDLDPCSNPRSKVRAKKTYSLEAGENGILLPWSGLVYANGPYSDLMPWAQKLEVDRKKVDGCGFLVNADHSPEWWKLLTQSLRIRLDFDVRLEFDPPPGVEPSKNDRPQSLLMDEPFWAKCKQPELLDRGQLWRRA